MAHKTTDHAITAAGLTGAAADATYAGVTSFMRRKYTKDVDDADVVVWTDHPLSIDARPVKTIVDGAVLFDQLFEASIDFIPAFVRHHCFQRGTGHLDRQVTFTHLPGIDDTKLARCLVVISPG